MDTKCGNCSETCENSDKVGHRMTSSDTNSENCPGCGLSDLDKITITVAPTTGGTFDISVQKDTAVENLKKVISKKLKVPKERILLLHKERQLRDGNLQQNSIYHGSTLTLLPSVETGLLSQRPEQGVMQALESLNDSQVNDFLSGKAPLNLTMRLGDHMMLIQLQLSSVTPSMTRKSSSAVSLQQNHRANESYLTKHNVPSASEGPSTSSIGNIISSNTSGNSTNCRSSNSSSNSSNSSSCSSSSSNNISSSNISVNNSSDPELTLPNLNLIKSRLNTLLHKNNENLNALKRKLHSGEEDMSVKRNKPNDDNMSKYFKDLNLKNVLLDVSESSQEEKKSLKYSDIMRESTGAELSSSGSQSNEELQAKKSEILSQIMESVRKISENTSEITQTIEGTTCDNEVRIYGSKCNVNCTCSNKTEYSLASGVKNGESTALDTKALAEASRNLTQTLKQLSSEVFTCRSDNSDFLRLDRLIFLGAGDTVVAPDVSREVFMRKNPKIGHEPLAN
ncbi:hypothetical protein RUM44_000007 [Polyplax serrata]|uniref:Ubiquitin-like domain-containing protein n=1 Tax=Polyplax serrata TaxID=468196 RepID=A0ABR1B485_POLSC